MRQMSRSPNVHCQVRRWRTSGSCASRIKCSTERLWMSSARQRSFSAAAGFDREDGIDGGIAKPGSRVVASSPVTGPKAEIRQFEKRCGIAMFGQSGFESARCVPGIRDTLQGRARFEVMAQGGPFRLFPARGRRSRERRARLQERRHATGAFPPSLRKETIPSQARQGRHTRAEGPHIIGNRDWPNSPKLPRLPSSRLDRVIEK